MKRKALLTITGCTVKAFESYAARGFLPFPIEDRNWSDYSLDDAILLRLMLEAVKGTDVASASYIAGNAFHRLESVHPLYYTDNQELFVGLLRYNWPDAPDSFSEFRTVIGGRWCDLEARASAFLKDKGPTATIGSIFAVSITKAAEHVWTEARELGLPEGEEMPGVPEDLSEFPDWFQKIESERRACLGFLPNAQR